jgi:hypothetical protein
MMDPREFRGAVLVRACLLIMQRNLSMPEARAEAIKQLAAEQKLEQKKRPRRAVEPPPPPPPMPPPADADRAGELAGAKDRFFAMLKSYFARVDARKARERAAQRAERAERRAARKAAKAAAATPVAHAPPPNVVPFVERTVREVQPVPPSPESTHPCGYLLDAGGSSGATRIDESEFPSCYQDPVTQNWRESIARNEQRRSEKERRERGIS